MFLQLLESERDDVFTLYRLICADPRNRNNYLMWDAPIAQRCCPDWSMGFLAPSAIELESWPGYCDFFGTGYDTLAHTRNASTGKRFLLWHREACLRQLHREGKGEAPPGLHGKPV